MWTGLYVLICVYICIYIYVYISVCAWIYSCMYVHMHVYAVGWYVYVCDCCLYWGYIYIKYWLYITLPSALYDIKRDLSVLYLLV